MLDIIYFYFIRYNALLKLFYSNIWLQYLKRIFSFIEIINKETKVAFKTFYQDAGTLD